MDPEKRIVPEKHISYLLEEDTISERTIETKKLLHNSPNKLHHVAHKWMGHSGLDPMARVIIHHIPSVPKKIHTPHSHWTEKHSHTSEHSTNTHEEVYHEATASHTPHAHSEHATWHVHNEHHDDHHGLYESHHWHHDHSGHEHGWHSHGHHANPFSSFVSTGHWFGDQWAYIFGMIGRIIGEIVGYVLKALVVALIFGPTRTIILVTLVCALLNNSMDINIPIWISAGIAGIIHLIFTSINKMSGWGHWGGHGEWWGHGGHGGDHGHH